MKDADPNDVHSAMQGDFVMGGGVISLFALTYTVPGANIELKGTYTLEGQELNFAGKAKLDGNGIEDGGRCLGHAPEAGGSILQKGRGRHRAAHPHHRNTRGTGSSAVDFGHKTVTMDVPKGKAK